MRSLRFLAIATSCAAIVISRALADPGDSKLKLWVQTPLSSPASLGMFLDLAANDPRVTPILRAETRRFVLVGTNPDQFVQDPDPIVPAGQIAAGVQALIEHFRAAPLSAPANNVLNGHGVAIMLSGFGFGGRDNEQHPTTNLGAVAWFSAPALARPHDHFVPFPGYMPPDLGSDDQTHSPHLPWLTPWFDHGPRDCAEWLHAFAASYTSRMQYWLEHNYQDADASALQPVRLIFDLEAEAGDFVSPEVNTLTIPFLRGTDTGVPGMMTEARFGGDPVKGYPFGPNQFDVNDGPYLNQLFNSPLPPCDLPNDPRDLCSPAFLERYRLTYICNQAQNAALDRAVRFAFPGAPNTPAINGFDLGTRPGSPLLYTNFGAMTTDGVKDETKPPYSFTGTPLRRVSARDKAYYVAIKNYADVGGGGFGSPVSYAYTLGAPLEAGQSRSDFVLQDMRQTLESAVLSDGFFTSSGVRGGDAAITPWIAGPNLYFVNADHHRKLFALMRSHYCNEFNVFLGFEFMGSDPAAHARAMANWSKFRHVIDQVWGFDLDPGNSAVTLGTAYSGGFETLANSDFRFMHVQSTPRDNGAMNYVRIEPTFKVFSAAYPDATWDRYSVRDSANLRVNIEYTTQLDGPGPTPIAAAPAIDVRMWNYAKVRWESVPMTKVCADAYSASQGTRSVLTGMVSNRYVNSNHRLVDQQSGQTIGTAKVQATLTWPGAPFTVHFDLLQVVGVDANEDDLDWNHDGVVNGRDLLDYLEDFACAWMAFGQAPISDGASLLGLDADGDGYVTLLDPCVWYSLLDARGAITDADGHAFFDRVAELGLTLDCH